MRRTRPLAAVIGSVLLAAACGGGGSDVARRRLGAPAPPADVAVGDPAASGGTGEHAAAHPGGPDTTGTGASVSTPNGPAAGPASAWATTPQTSTEIAASPAAGRTTAGPAGRNTNAAAAATGASGGAAQGPSDRTASRTQGDRAANAPTPSLPDPGARTGVSEREVLFGMHLPLSGPVGVVADEAWHGAAAYFRAVNQAGGVHGRKIRMVISDDAYSAQKAAGAIRELVDRDKVFAASCLVGADQCVVGLEYANAKGVPYLHGGMSEGVVEGKVWSYPVTASYPYGGARLIDYLFSKKGYTPARRIGALHVNSPHFAETALRMEQRLAHYGSRFAVKQVAEKDQSDFSATIIKLKNAGVDTLWLFIDPTLVTKFVAQAEALRFKPQYVFSPPVGGDLFATAGGGRLDGAYALATFADPQWSGAAGFRKTFAAAYPDDDPNEFDVLSYVVAQVFVEGLRRSGADLGRDAFARAMGSIDHFDTDVSSPFSYTTRHRLEAANSTLAVWEIHGTKTDQVTGFDF